MTKKQLFTILEPKTWSASIIPVLIGTLYSTYRVGNFRLDLFIAVLFSAVGVQCFANVINDYSDYISGLDTRETVYDREGSILVFDDISLIQVKKLMACLVICTLFPAVYLIFHRGLVVAVIGIIGFLVAYLYSAGPLPISKTFLGELFSGLTMGGLITWLAYYVQAGYIDENIILISIPLIIYIGSILLTNGICDIEKDQGTRVTIPILMGRERSIDILKFAYIMMYVFVFLSIVLKSLPVSMFLIFLSIPLVVKKLKFIAVENITLKNRSKIMENSVLSGIIFFFFYIIIILGEILRREFL
ncbi:MULTISPECIES: prenyltransferase [Psychrilyobacter]|uniref:Prenyltransferase n=1 Tax=Psychrilyobacter piezotolerans TaxID=2293438 RepID=A0ABX9KJG6_9FUSO|nr:MULTISPECIES: prenyltransferase [Psychrilyobacter]MCS5421751.1 prenyltransferase [Psychrilyobacter sp. S5]NDI77056.1 prenyltransferase [Psychrilyobacter piezotolerans]RDE64673.1 prenyltransferase [Psychrilyobacter sp. S5]REI42485.1 prenyltransferase [Psychrilyobacter piezotolerans]